MRSYTLFDKFYYSLIVLLSWVFDPASRKTGWSFIHLNNPSKIKTNVGEKDMVAEIAGTGRIVNVQYTPIGVEVTIAHGKWAGYFANTAIEFEWINNPAGDPAPFIYSPTQQLANDFSRNSFSIRLYPRIDAQDRLVIPAFKNQALVKYRLAALDAVGTEGVALDFRPA